MIPEKSTRKQQDPSLFTKYANVLKCPLRANSREAQNRQFIPKNAGKRGETRILQPPPTFFIGLFLGEKDQKQTIPFQVK